MKKLLIILLAASMCLLLCACPASEQGAPSGTPQVHITAGEIRPGMTAKDVFVEVTIDHQPVACRVTLTGFAWDGYWDMEEDETVPEEFSVRLNIFYSLPKGYDVDQIQVTMDCDGGTYDGTGSISNDDEGNMEAWSRAFYGKEPLAPENQTSQTLPLEEEHIHVWEEAPGVGIVDCTIDGVQNYTCSCGETKSETIPAPGHDMQISTTDPTCTDCGTQTYRCKRCSYVLKVEIPAAGHTWSEWEMKTGRVHSRSCAECGAEEEENHNIPDGEVTCTDCGADIIN